MKQEFRYGAVLKIQREFTLDTIYHHLSSMKKLGMNQVVVWPAIYWWEDSSYDDYPFHTGKKILEYAEELHMKVIMELEGQITCLQYAPDFLMKEDYYPVDRNGHSMNQGSGYGYLNYSHPEVWQLVELCFTDAAKAYKDYAALYGFDIYNETRFESYDIYTLRAFREWLKEKYGTIEILNRVWERTYYDWSQIQFSYWMWASVMPVVDYNQFKKAYMNSILKSWNSMIKKIIPDTVVIADNVYATVSEDKHYDLPQDDWGIARSVDEFGISLYPKNDSTGFVPYRRWMTLAGIHSASPTGKFWISELQSHNVSMFNTMSTVHTRDIDWWNMEAIVGGAKGIIYWKWDPFMKGVQTLGRGLVDVKGNYTYRAREAGKIAALLHEYSDEFVNYQPYHAEASILYDSLNHDFTKAYSRNHGQALSDSIYLDSIDGLYHCLWNQQVYPEFVSSPEIIENPNLDCQVLFVTSQVYMSKELSAALLTYAEQGGTIICDGRFGMVDETGYVYEQIPGGPCNEALGIEFHDLDTEELHITMNEEWDNLLLEGYYERQVWNVQSERADIIGTFDDGMPAVTDTAYGKGKIISIATYLWYACHCGSSESPTRFIKLLSEKYNLRKQYSDAAEIKVGRIGNSSGELIFVFQYENTELCTTIYLELQVACNCRVFELDTGKEIPAKTVNGMLEFQSDLKGCQTKTYHVIFDM